MSIFQSLLLGISLAAIPGLVFFELIRRTLTKNYKSSVLIIIGVFIANFLTLGLAFLGLSYFLTYNISKIILYLIGSGILIWLGISAFKVKKEEIEESYKKKITKHSSIFLGMVLAAANPIYIAFTISLAGSYFMQFSSYAAAFLNILFLDLGVVIVYSSLIAIVHYTKHKISTKYILLLSKIFGLVLLGYAALFLYQFAKLIL